MRTYNRNFNNNFDRNFKRMTVVFWVFFAVAAVFIFTIWSVMGYAAYQVVSDPQGTASFLGNIAADVIRPVAEVIKE